MRALLSRATGGPETLELADVPEPTAGKGELHIDRATYTGPPVRPGDAVQALSRPGRPWFEVLRVDDRGETRLVLELGEK